MAELQVVHLYCAAKLREARKEGFGADLLELDRRRRVSF